MRGIPVSQGPLLVWESKMKDAAALAGMCLISRDQDRTYICSHMISVSVET